MTEPWAIVHLRLRPRRDDRAGWADDLDRFSELAAMLASEPDVGGVEHSTTSPEEPVLHLYTTPAAMAEVMARAHAWRMRFALDVTITSEVRTDDDWRDAWKQFYHPILLGELDGAEPTKSNGSDTRLAPSGQLLLRPSWIPRRAGDPEREVVLDPGRAFGTGLHETTRLCLDRLCDLERRGFAAREVLDLGCGSGILALCAARLFPGARIVALDDDPEATATAVENAAANGLAGVEIVTGDLDRLAPTPRFDLVLANIRAETLMPRARALAERTLAQAEVVLSGVLLEERDDVERAYVDAGFVVQAPARAMGMWCAIDLQRSS
ncbi:MAG TPA: 50S ribosomal protein L11 methyltransferase [Nannocystaceae bacterium]|nr:50S ribosomal protein L11 methyltransferase [Nannocystaceae bacterium]